MKLLNEYYPEYQIEEEYKIKMTNLFNKKGKDAFFRNSLDAHFTASAWIMNLENNEVLLLHHKKLNKWLQPGGHADGETNLEAVARKEAYEETNLKNLKLVSPIPFDLDIHLIPEHKGTQEHYHYDVRFVYFCIDKEIATINHESNAFKWIKINEIRNYTQESSILRMASKSKQLVHGA